MESAIKEIVKTIVKNYRKFVKCELEIADLREKNYLELAQFVEVVTVVLTLEGITSISATDIKKDGRLEVIYFQVGTMKMRKYGKRIGKKFTSMMR